MSLMPEKLAYFRIAVRSQYEEELLKALTSVGKIHLEEPLETRHLLPGYLIEVLEGGVTYASLNVDEALAAARKVLRPGDILLAKIEEKANQLKNLQALRILADRLEALGIQPETIGKARYGTIVDLVFLEEEDLASAFLDLSKIGAVVRRIRLMPHTYALLPIYTQEKASAVEKIKKVYGKDFSIPPWFFGKLETVKARIEEEEARLRKELLDLLVDTASALRDAVEFEKAARVDVLESAKKAVEDVRNLLPKIEEITLKTFTMYIAAKAYLNGKLLALTENTKPGEIHTIIKNILQNEVIKLKLVKKVAAHLDLEEELIRNTLIYNSLLRGEALIAELRPTGQDFFLLICGDNKLKELIQSNKLSVYGTSILFSESTKDYHVAALKGPEGLLKGLAEQLEDKAVNFVVPFTDEGLKKLEKNISLRLEEMKSIIISDLLLLQFRKDKASVSRILAQVGDEEAASVWSAFEQLVEGELPPPPAESVSELLKNVITSADEVSAGVLEIASDLESLSHLPLSEVSNKTGPIIEKLSSLLRNACYVVGSADQLEVILKVQPMIREIRVLRSRRITVVEGYIPSKYKETLHKLVSERVPQVLYFKVVDIARREKAPTYVESRGLWKYLHSITLMRGVPAYWELNPTLFFTVLFAAMYGMMFGDVGQGILLSLFGAWLLKTRYRLLGITEEGAASLGALALLAGASSIAFGLLYGFVVFLKPLAHPVISPVHDVYEIVAIALWFGAAQLLLGMILNVVNLLMYGDRLGALFSGMGGMGILFYASGIIVAYRLATSGFDLALLSDPSLKPLLLCIACSLISVMAFGVYEAEVKGEREKLMHSVSEVVEMIIALPANSLSYIRLAAFAMAHEAFGILAESMSTMFGEITSLIIANLLVLAIEALAVGIQALRLTYYEFSSKFFKGEGVEFKPLISFGKAP